MTTPSNAPEIKLQLLTKNSKSGKTQKSFDVTPGTGDAGVPLRIKAESATRYELLDPKRDRAPEHVRAKRAGRDLQIFFEGSVEADIIIEQYYDEAIVEFPKDSLTGILPKGDLAIYVIDEGLRPALTTLESNVTPIVLLENVAWLPHGWTGVAGVASAAALGIAALSQSQAAVPPPGVPTADLAASSDTGVSNSDHITGDTTPTITGTGVAGNTIKVTMPGTGEVITTVVAADGTWSVTPTQALAVGLVGNVSVVALNSAGVASVATVVPLTIVGDLVITGSVAAGPVYEGVSLYAYDENGVLLGEAAIQSDGTYRIATPARGDYRGTVLLKVIDANAASANYVDEVTAASKSLNTELRAMGLAQVGQAQFTVSGQNSHLIINITPLTELAVRQAGVTGNTPASASAAQTANTNVATAFGLSGVDITGAVTPTNTVGFDARDGLSNAEKYGIALTKLSGLDSLNAGNMSTSLDLLAANLSGAALSTAGATLVDQGRAKALSNLKTPAAPTFSAGSGDTDTNTMLNRQLLGDIVVTAQELDSTGRLIVSGTALPGVTLTVTLPNGQTQQTVVDATGHFSLTSTTVQPVLDTPVKVVGADALSVPVANAAPNVPVIDTGNGKVITGSADPATVVTVKDAAGHVLGTAVADALGYWSLTPATPLTSVTPLTASAVDPAGNASGPGAGVTDPNAVVIAIPEASDGYVDAAEKASGGGVPIDVSLPANAAVGDVIKSVVTLPNGTTITLTKVLNATDVTAGHISQLMGPAELPVDGLYQVSSTRTNAQGTSAPSLRSFLLDTGVPDAPVIAPSNGQIITGTAEPGTTVTVLDAQGHVIGTAGPVGPGGN
jgi:hypothetical protein